MKKIGIATITILSNSENAYNYGNKLQNYALQEYLRKEGFLPETIKYNSIYPKYEQANGNVKKRKSFLQFIDDAFRIIKRKMLNKQLQDKRNKRREKFNKFVDNYIKYNENTYEYNSDFSNLAEEYDYFVTGSDQVWNPYYEGYNPFYYLNFAPKEKRIAYAPSIAVNSIPDEFKNEFKELVNGLTKISIREDEGKQLLKEEFAVDAKLVCDPVFLLTKDEWKEIAEYPKIEKKYFLVYILGKKSVITKRKIKYFEKKYNMKAIDLFSKDDIKSSFAGPQEFLGLLDNAEFVITDSFHGAAFSTIFEKSLIILERDSQNVDNRKKMNSRINSLLRLIEDENRSADYIIEHPDELFMNYSKNKAKIEDFINDSKKYLIESLNS